MRCPYCGSSDSEVIETRDSEDLTRIRRRRQCLKCGKRFTTYEKVENVDLIVIKKDGIREQFDRDKLKKGILNACEKTKVSLEQVENIIEEIEKDLLTGKTIEIDSKKIGQLVGAKLKKINKIAYIRFASVFKEFVDLEEFRQELDKLLKK